MPNLRSEDPTFVEIFFDMLFRTKGSWSEISGPDAKGEVTLRIGEGADATFYAFPAAGDEGRYLLNLRSSASQEER